MIKVFHAKILTELVSNEVLTALGHLTIRDDIALVQDVLTGKFAGKLEYVEVAHVDTADLEVAFRLTNHIDTDWTTNDEVTAFTTRNRSSSTGDVFEKDGKKYLVAMFGFKEINSFNVTKETV